MTVRGKGERGVSVRVEEGCRLRERSLRGGEVRGRGCVGENSVKRVEGKHGRK